MTNFLETPWVELSVPELLWIALLEREDFLKGHGMAEALVRTVAEVRPGTTYYGTASSFSALSTLEGENIRERLSKFGALRPIQEALGPLARLYPAWPLGFLWSEPPCEGVREAGDLPTIRRVLETTMNKYERQTFLVQVSMLLFGFALKRVRIAKGLVLGRLVTKSGREEALMFPNTEESRTLGAAVFSWVPIVFGPPLYDPSWSFPAYFWNRGLDLQPCRFCLND
jgi:hypothetical protein